MELYVINLARRPDRLRAMARQLNQLGLAFRQVEAIDAASVPDQLLERYFAETGPLGAVPKGDKCCTLSHIAAWRSFLSTGDELAVILEDDVALDHAAADILAATDWMPAHVDVLKLEHFGPDGQRIVIGEQTDVGAGRTIARLHSRHTGAAAYIIRRKAAEMLLTKVAIWTVPVDHMLFNPNTSPVIGRLRPYQLLPPIARQSTAVGGDTDIGAWRAAQKRLGPSYIRRELVRAYYELRLLPAQVVRIAVGRGALVRVENEALNMPAARAGRIKHIASLAARPRAPVVECPEAMQL